MPLFGRLPDREPWQTANVRPDTTAILSPVGVTWPPQASQPFIMQAEVDGWPDPVLIEWWAASELDAVNTFGDWLLNAPVRNLNRSWAQLPHLMGFRSVVFKWWIAIPA